VLAATLYRHPLQRYAATSDEADGRRIMGARALFPLADFNLAAANGLIQ
jgi:hypothetical protein